MCNEKVSVFAAVNIPLSKVDHPAVRNFLQTRVENSRTIPQAYQLQEYMLLMKGVQQQKRTCFQKNCQHTYGYHL